MSTINFGLDTSLVSRHENINDSGERLNIAFTDYSDTHNNHHTGGKITDIIQCSKCEDIFKGYM